MAAVRSRGNASTELKFARWLRAAGLNGWRRHWPITGRPDFVWLRRKVAVFVDGVFWHGHPSLCRLPATNRAYWTRKIARNRARDFTVTHALRAAGWTVLRVWESELTDRHRARVLARLRRFVA